ncbi:MAG TPA: peptide deformylase [Rhodothermales bacterium]|nr:peptide deformylase [Rhodothermales bacterium]HRR08297.1 peptide deformylase [Rhodothermales bacterium]
MILPIRRYGDPVLRKEAQEITSNTPELQTLIDNMFETMKNADGVGLAAPQIGESIRLFVVDVRHYEEDYQEKTGEPFPDAWKECMVFINPEIIAESDEESEFEEGCLSVPDIHEMVTRPSKISLQYLDRHFTPQKMEVDKLMARVIQHEHDHLDGILFLDHMSAFKRRMLQRKLRDIQRGVLETKYPMAKLSA